MKAAKLFRNIGWGLAVGYTVVVCGLLTSGCAGDRYERSTGEYIDDKATVARVKSALKDEKPVKLSDVEVNSFRGTVQLSGFVNTDEQKSRAAEIAKGVTGVKEVVNNITVKK